MRLFVTCLFSLGLAVSPAMGDDGATKDSADTAKATPAKKSGDTAKKASPDSNSNFEAELQQLKDLLRAQSEELERQRTALDREHQKVQALEQRLGIVESAAPAAETPGTPATPTAGSADATPAVRSAARPQDKPKESPLSFRIGAAEFTPGGFVDFENVFRSTNTGNVAATSFGTIPFSNTVQGHLTEFRATGQYSRFNLKTHAKYGENDITGYLEFDFNGNDAANVFVSSNGHTDRLRLYWLDLKRGKWEFLGGQTWGLQTPNRVGVSPAPADLALTYGEDAQTHVGLNYTRAAEFRAAYHFNDNWVWAAAIQNPQQFVGAGEVIFPFAFNAALGVQFDAGNNAGAPNVAPDFLTKIAYDNTVAGGRHFHFEIGGLTTTAKATVVPGGGTTFQSHSTIGGGFMGALNFDLWKGSEGRNIRFVGSGMWGYGVGRYLIGFAPQVVVRPIQTGPAKFDIETSGVHAGDAILGFEFLPHPKAQFGVYYGGIYAQRNAFPDTTSPLVIKPIIGFGGINSPNSANRAIQEATIDWTQTFWKNPQYGAILLVTQASYVTRSPWFVPAGAPKNAHLMMGYVSLRYVLP